MDRLKNKILICAGGTGGHIIPALAIANEFIIRGYSVHWLGTRTGMEAQLVPSKNIPISYITIVGLRGKHWLTFLIIPFKILIALLQSIKILLNLKPALVLGMGGFVTGPSGIAAWLLRIPLIIHEQNAIPGTANRMLARFARKVLEGFPNSFTNMKQVQFTGNPIRTEFANLLAPTARFANRDTTKLRLLVVGGSRGALALNKCVPQALQQCHKQDIEVWHQTGQNHLEISLALYQSVSIVAKVVPFIEDMAAAYAWADLVVCRAGAITIAELAAAGIASILVPFPYAIDDHQTKNAEYLSKAGAAILIQEKDLTAEILAGTLQSFIKDRDKLLTMAQAARQLANYQALNDVVKHCLDLL
jgi:UDP-N-acetylglucosamine--N-acetylmuramyl-(pentapeptide) pyrophosphoryl-undecaprenol N-acetylglucosamine transferase